MGYLLRHSFAMEDCIVWDLNSIPDQSAFQVVQSGCSDKTIFLCASEAQKQNWMNEINQAVSDCEELQFTLPSTVIHQIATATKEGS